MAAGAHADPWDPQWPFGPPDDAEPPPQPFPDLPPRNDLPPNVTLFAEVDGGLASELIADSPSFGKVRAAGSTTRVDPILGPYESGGAASAIATGGSSPRIDVSTTSFGTHSVMGSGTVSYFFCVSPLNPEMFPDAIPVVPVLMYPSGGSSFVVGSPDADGSILVSVKVNRLVTVGVYHQNVVDGTPGPITDQFPALFEFSASPNADHEFVLHASAGVANQSPTGTSSAQAFVDPVILVDPEATFQHDGQTLLFVEHFGIASSPGFEQWQSVILRDGFESGAFGQWSATKP